MCDLDIPKSGVVLNQLHIVEYLDAEDGEIYKVDFSVAGDNSDLAMSKALELIEWARAFQVSPLIADMIHDYIHEDDDGDEEEPAI